MFFLCLFCVFFVSFQMQGHSLLLNNFSLCVIALREFIARLGKGSSTLGFHQEPLWEVRKWDENKNNNNNNKTKQNKIK